MNNFGGFFPAEGKGHVERDDRDAQAGAEGLTPHESGAINCSSSSVGLFTRAGPGRHPSLQGDTARGSPSPRPVPAATCTIGDTTAGTLAAPVVDVDQGDSILIQSPAGRTLFIDAGPLLSVLSTIRCPPTRDPTTAGAGDLLFVGDEIERNFEITCGWS